MKRLLAPALVLLVAVLACPTMQAAGLVDVLPETNQQLDSDIKSFRNLQEGFFKLYATAYAHYKADLTDLQQERANILAQLKDPKKLKEMAESGELQKYYLRAWENLLLSIGHQVKRIDALLCLKDLRQDIVMRVSTRFAGQAVTNELTMAKLEDELREAEKELGAAKEELQRLAQGDRDSPQLTATAARIKEKKHFIEAARNKIEEIKVKHAQNEAFAGALRKDAARKMASIHEELKGKRRELFNRLRLLRTDIYNFNPSVEMNALVEQFKKRDIETDLVSQALDEFDKGYRDMQRVDSAIWSIHKKGAGASDAQGGVEPSGMTDEELRKLME